MVEIKRLASVSRHTNQLPMLLKLSQRTIVNQVFLHVLEPLVVLIVCKFHA